MKYAGRSGRGHTITMLDHEYDPKIPEGFACLAMGDNGWVGTSNGWPHAGQPAMFPLEQAEAIAVAWNCAVLAMPKNMYHPECVSEEARNWLGWDLPPAAAPSEGEKK